MTDETEIKESEKKEPLLSVWDYGVFVFIAFAAFGVKGILMLIG